MEKQKLIICGLGAAGTALILAVAAEITATKLAEEIWKWFNKHVDVVDNRTEEEKEFHLRKPPHIWNNVLFFPDTNPDSEESPTKQFYSYFKNAKISIYICIHLFSCYPLAGIIMEKKNQGLVVRVISDYDRTDNRDDNSSIQFFRRHGIEVRTKNTRYLMHHKFAVIDDEALIAGSINWTQCAFKQNVENAVITTHPKTVANYRNEFHKLWKEAAPHGKNNNLY